MIRKITLSPRAKQDLASIWRYSASEHGQEAADAYIRDLDQTIQMIRTYPEIGVDSSDVRKGYRRMGSGSHLIYYIARPSEVYVIRVLHGRQDAGRQSW